MTTIPKHTITKRLHRSEMAKPRIALQVVKGALVPIDDQGKKWLNDHCKLGDILSADLRKSRNSRFNRLVHALGRLCSEQIEAFNGKDAHSCLKQMQLEGQIACEQQKMELPGIGSVMVSIPKSLSFDAMDETEFQSVAKDMSRLIAARYMQTLTPEAIERMAELMIGER